MTNVAYHQITDPERLHALIDAIMLIEQEADLTELLADIVKLATNLVGARYGALGVVSQDGQQLTRFITHGMTDEESALIGAAPHGRGLLGETIHHGAPVRVPDLHVDERAVGFPAGHPDMTAFLGVPVTTGDGHIFGNLYLANADGDPVFSEQDEQLVEAFGRAAGLVIDQATLRSRLREYTLTEERERLARDLHDTVIQRIFGVGLALQMTLPAITDPDARTRVDRALDDLDDTVREIRTTIFEIDFEQVTSHTLVERIMALTSELGQRLGVTALVTLDPALSDGVSDNVAQNLTQALREILSNIARHSQATEVDVRVDLEDSMVVLSIRDNGVGFIANVGPGRGLRNLSARARLLGGSCTVESNLGSGTLVRWTSKRMD